MLRFFIRIILISSLLLFSTIAAPAAQDEVLLAKMKVVREINLGGVYEYEVECEGRGRAILKTSPLRLKAGEAINLFVQEGAKEGGKPAYMTLTASSARSFKEGFAAVHIGGSWSFIDKNGRLLSQRGFIEAKDFQDGFALVRLKDGLAFLGRDGELLPTPTIRILDYSNVSFMNSRAGFSEGVAIMGSQTTDNKDVVVILDKSGSVVTVVKDPSDLRMALPFTEGLSAASKFIKDAVYGNNLNLLFGYIDKSSKLVIPFEFREARPFKDGRAAVLIKEKPGDDGRWGFINTSGKLIGDAKYEAVGDFAEGLAAVKNGGKWGFIDKEGNVRINLSYDYISSPIHDNFPFSEGLAIVKRGNLYGAIDKNGQVVIKFLYYDMKTFVNGLAPAKDEVFGGKYGYLDKTGKFAIAAQFNDANSFSDGLALVRHDINNVPRYKYINTKGQAALWFYMPSR